MDALFNNGSRYNLLNSSILELFKYVHDENVKTLLEHTHETFGERLKTIKYTDIFEKIQTKVQQDGDEQVILPIELTYKNFYSIFSKIRGLGVLVSGHIPRQVVIIR